MYEEFSSFTSPFVISPTDQKEKFKLLTDWLNEVVNIIISTTYPHSHQQMFENCSYREYEDDIIIDGDNSMASCFMLPKKRIWCIYKEINGIGVLLDNSTIISFSTFKCNPNLWYKNKMNKNWDMGRMWLYV